MNTTSRTTSINASGDQRFLLSILIGKTSLAVPRVIVGAVPVTPLSTVLIPIVGIPVDAAICAVVPAELSAGQLDLLVHVLLFHSMNHPFIVFICNFLYKEIHIRSFVITISSLFLLVQNASIPYPGYIIGK